MEMLAILIPCEGLSSIFVDHIILLYLDNFIFNVIKKEASPSFIHIIIFRNAINTVCPLYLHEKKKKKTDC